MLCGRVWRRVIDRQTLLSRTLNGIGSDTSHTGASRKKSLQANYSTNELDALVTEYEELADFRGKKAFIHVRLIDVDRVLKRLPPVEAEAVFLCGIVGHNFREAGKLVGVSHTTMRRRFLRGLDYMAHLLNGGL